MKLLELELERENYSIDDLPLRVIIILTFDFIKQNIIN